MKFEEFIEEARKEKIGGREVIWKPLPGAQDVFLKSVYKEVLLTGNRGGGKTSALIVDFVQEVGKGFGASWRGVIFRRTYKELDDIIAKSKELIPRAFGGDATFNEQKTEWRFPTGEVLMFRVFEKPDDYWKFHGQEIPFIGWEELTTWPEPTGYLRMFSCNRSAKQGMPKKIRATTNPSGPGHNWVKRRFRLGGHNKKLVLVKDALDAEGKPEPPRAAIFCDLADNYHLLNSDENYIQTIRTSAENEAQLKAWLLGSWDIVAGGALDDIWEPTRHVIRPFEIPAQWRITRSFDWGWSKPFAAIWVAESNGDQATYPDGKVFPSIKGDRFIIAELYGSNGEPNVGIKKNASEVAADMRNLEVQLGIVDRVRPGPADNAIFVEDNGNCIANDMAKRVLIRDGSTMSGVTFSHSDKRPGSRKMSFQRVREYLKASAMPWPREKPGLFFFDTCKECIRTLPTLPRDKRDPDDVDSSSEDHLYDAIRYSINAPNDRVRSGRLRGLM